MQNNISEHKYFVSKEQRNSKNQHKSLLLWFTGLSGSGKSTIASALEKKLFQEGYSTFALDGDNLRYGLNKDLGFSSEDRSENIRRISEVSKLMIDAGLVVLAAFVSPYEKDRDLVQKTVGTENFYEIYVSTSLEICEERDTKGLYKKARDGEIANMTGISAPYEPPMNPFITLDTEIMTIDQAVSSILERIIPKLNL